VITNSTINTVTSPVGLNTVMGKGLQFSVFPNPAKEEFTVSCIWFPVGERIVLRLFDTLGREILSKEMKSDTSQLPVAGIQPGIYFLQIETENGTVVKKLIKE